MKDSSLWLVLLSRTRLPQPSGSTGPAVTLCVCMWGPLTQGAGRGGFLTQKWPSSWELASLAWEDSDLLVSVSWSSDPLDKMLDQLCLKPVDIEEITSCRGPSPLRYPTLLGWAASVTWQLVPGNDYLSIRLRCLPLKCGLSVTLRFKTKQNKFCLTAS